MPDRAVTHPADSSEPDQIKEIKMPTKSSKSKSSAKYEKVDAPRQKVTVAQVAFGIFALLLVVTMILSLVVQGN